jgi:hypothetical protein
MGVTARRYSFSRLVCLVCLVAAVLLLFARDAFAYCRLTTCDPKKGDECEMNEGGCVRSGAGLRWRSLPIQYRFSAQGSTKLDVEAARDAVRRAFDNWTNVECPNGGRTSLSFKEVADSRGDSDPWTIHFRDDEWPHDDGDESLALTNHRYGKYTGFIEFADIEINTATTPFAVSKDDAGLDLETVVTHEVGHYIGLAHSHVRGSIMAPRYCQDGEACGTAQLSDDDVAAVCLVYPPSSSSGINDELAPLPPPAQGCSTTPSRSPLLPLTCLVGIALILGVRRIRISRTTV